MRRRIDLETGRRYIEDLPDHTGPLADDIVDTEVDINTGHIWPAHDELTNAWVEGATQQELDDRAASVAEQTLIAAARAQLSALKAAHKNLALDVTEVEVFLVELGKAGYQRAVSYRDAALASRQAYQAWVASPPTAQNAVTALTSMFTETGTQEENRRQADIAYLAALQALKAAIDARNP